MANSSHSSLGAIIASNTFGESQSGGSLPYQSAIEGSFCFGQYVPFDSGLPMSRIANGATNSLNIVGLRFFIAGGGNTTHYLDFVTDSPAVLPAGSRQNYTVNCHRI